MPNWCQNTISISHHDPAMIQKIVDAKDGLFEAFIPTPKSLLLDEGWYVLWWPLGRW